MIVSQFFYAHGKYPPVTRHSPAQGVAARRKNRRAARARPDYCPHCAAKWGGAPIRSVPRFCSSRQKDIWCPYPKCGGGLHKRSWTLLTVYADSSFLVSLYIQDVHSPAARQ